MNISFCIISNKSTQENLAAVFRSIFNEFGAKRDLSHEVEILVLGDVDVSAVWQSQETHEGAFYRRHIQFIHFNDDLKPGWITKKKNIFPYIAKYDNLVIMHDYLVLQPGWYEGFESFGQDWNIQMNQILRNDGSRFLDWCLTSYRPWAGFGAQPSSPHIPNCSYVEYGDNTMKENMYIPGNYFVCKKHVLLEEPFDERLLHCQWEDIEWSDRVLKKYNYQMNKNCAVKMLKTWK